MAEPLLEDRQAIVLLWSLAVQQLVLLPRGEDAVLPGGGGGEEDKLAEEEDVVEEEADTLLSRLLSRLMHMNRQGLSQGLAYTAAEVGISFPFQSQPLVVCTQIWR